MKVTITLGLISSLFFSTPVIVQNRRPARQSASVTGEYREFNQHDKETSWGDTTFNIERNKRTRKYRLWVGSMGTSSMNYHNADARSLQINDRTGALSFAYTDDEQRCSFSGTVKDSKIVGQLDCTGNGQQESKHIVLKRYRAAASGQL